MKKITRVSKTIVVYILIKYGKIIIVRILGRNNITLNINNMGGLVTRL